MSSSIWRKLDLVHQGVDHYENYKRKHSHLSIARQESAARHYEAPLQLTGSKASSAPYALPYVEKYEPREIQLAYSMDALAVRPPMMSSINYAALRRVAGSLEESQTVAFNNKVNHNEQTANINDMMPMFLAAKYKASPYDFDKIFIASTEEMHQNKRAYPLNNEFKNWFEEKTGKPLDNTNGHSSIGSVIEGMFKNSLTKFEVDPFDN